MKYGRLAHDPAAVAALPRAAPHLDSYTGALPSPDWTRDVAPNAWGMYRNDTLGDCTAAGIAHAIVVAGAYCPPARLMTDADVVDLYSATSGYVPGRAETDHGARCLDVLRCCFDNGIVCGGSVERLSAYPTIDPRNHTHVRIAIEVFGGIYAGVVLHEAQDTELTWSDLTSPVIGGHLILIVAADDDGLTAVTWGETRRITWPWWDASCDEAYGLLMARWIGAGRTPEGFPLDTVLAEAAALEHA